MKEEKSDSALWFHEYNHWWVGEPKDLGTNAGWLYSVDAPVCVLDAKTWKLFKDGQWVDAGVNDVIFTKGK